jgi:hypothetical protein
MKAYLMCPQLGDEKDGIIRDAISLILELNVSC